MGTSPPRVMASSRSKLYGFAFSATRTDSASTSAHDMFRNVCGCAGAVEAARAPISLFSGGSVSSFCDEEEDGCIDPFRDGAGDEDEGGGGRDVRDEGDSDDGGAAAITKARDGVARNAWFLRQLAEDWTRDRTVPIRHDCSHGVADVATGVTANARYGAEVWSKSDMIITRNDVNQKNG